MPSMDLRSSTLGLATSVTAIMTPSSPGQSSVPSHDSGSTKAKSSEVVIPAARARSNKLSNGAPPSASTAGISGGYPRCSRSPTSSALSNCAFAPTWFHNVRSAPPGSRTMV